MMLDSTNNPVRFITALPVFNEAQHVDAVLDEVCSYSEHVLVVDDGSTDGTGRLLQRRQDILIRHHDRNLGYGAALKTAFAYATQHDYEVIVTVDCDGQHQPQRIPRFVAACNDADIVSGSRYLEQEPAGGAAPADRRRINQLVTAELNARLGLRLTDAFCGFKAYRVSALRRLELQEDGYAMPLELWVQAVHHCLSVKELAVPLIYLDEQRSFGGALDDANTRLEHYLAVMDRSFLALRPSACAEPAKLLCEEGVG